MAETADESWWLKVGIMYDKSGFRSAALAMIDLKKAAIGIGEAFRKVVDVNSDLYNTAKYLGVTTNDLQIWERAFKLIGGSADEARGAISSLNFVYDKLRLGMDSGAAEIGARLGLTPEDYTSFENMMRGLNRTYNEMFKGDYGGFKVLAEQLGLSKSAMLLVTQSTEEYEATLRRAGRTPVIPEHQLRAARELDKMFTDLSIKWDVFKSKLLSASMPGVERLFKRLEEFMDNPETINNLEAFFRQLEISINALASNENLKDLISLLDDLVKAGAQVAEWGVDIGKFAKFGAEYYGEKGGQAVGAFERFTSEHPALTKGAQYVTTSLNPGATLSGAVLAGTKQLVQNIVIDGAANPKEVGQAVVDAMKQAYGLDSNSSMRTIDTMKATTGL